MTIGFLRDFLPRRKAMLGDTLRNFVIAVSILCLVPAHVFAQAGLARQGIKAAREAVESWARRAGVKLTSEAVESMTTRAARLVEKHGPNVLKLVEKHGDGFIVAAERYGDDAVRAVARSGQSALLHLGTEVGQKHGPAVVKLFADYGDEAIWIVSKPERMAIFVKYGSKTTDDVARLLIRHKDIGVDLIQAYGDSAVRPLAVLSPKNGRRLLMMHRDKELEKIGRTEELLGVIGKYGDKAMEFIWKYKCALTVATALTAFLMDPEPFIEGTKDILQVVGQTGVQPITEGVREAAKQTNWTVIGIIGIVTLAALVALRWYLRHRPCPSRLEDTTSSARGNASASV